MATYQELLQASEDKVLRDRIRVAIVIAAEVVRLEATATPNNANRLKWAKAAFASPVGTLEPMVWAVLAANKAQPLATILAASDATVQSAVDAAVNVLAQG